MCCDVLQVVNFCTIFAKSKLMEQNIINSIHQYLFTHRLKHRDVAEAAGITRQAFSCIINHKHTAKFATVCAIIEAMQMIAGVTWQWPEQ